MLLALLIALIIYETAPRKKGIEKTLLPYVIEVDYISEGNLDGTKLNINFGNTLDHTLGICYLLRNEVIINKKKWKSLDYKGRILLIAHEIGHCSKKKTHINGLDRYGCAKHFMHYSTTGKWCDNYKYKEYVKQMKEL